MLDLASCAFRAMGTDVNVLVLDGEDADLQWAHGEIERLEALWSRFQEQSEVSRLNRGAGCWVDVAPETVDLLGAALEAWEATDGAFDPVLGAELVALGYDRTFDQIDRTSAGSMHPPAPVPRRPDDLEVDASRARARVAVRRALDLGGLAKGWTADHIVAGLRARGAAGACANLGGDLAVAGRAPRDAGWYASVDHDAARVPPGMLAVRQGGVATSTRLRRRWRGPGGDDRHHLLDPQGRPCTGPVVEVTAVAGLAARAEVLTKLAFVAPDRIRGALRDGEAALLTATDGATAAVGALHLVQPIARSVDVAG